VSDTSSTALVTGASRGLGRETCRQLAKNGYRVVLTARDAGRAANVAGELGVDHLPLDVTDPVGIDAAAGAVQERYGRLDVLVNNAGVLIDDFDASSAATTIDVNCTGAIRVTDAFRPLLSETARVVMVSSGLGELSCLSSARRKAFEDPALTRARLGELMQEFVDDVASGVWKSRGWPRSAYSVSKAGLNAFTRILDREMGGRGIRFNSVCPGWVRTDMGGPSATRDLTTGGRSIVWAATLGSDGPSGGFFRDGRRIPW
jgi:carbonyl reductase 1